MLRLLRYATPAFAVLLAGAISGSAASPTPPPTRQQLAQRLLGSTAGRYLTGPSRAALEAVARGDHRLSADASVDTSRAVKTTAGHGGGGTPLVNVRVNAGGPNAFAIDQTTQSETSIAVAGSRVAVGYNTSQHALLFLTAGTNLSGVASSTDGGQTFQDGGVIPNAPGYVNLGDPWLASDSAGTMYYSTLAIGGLVGNLQVGVASSGDGGRTWSSAAPIPVPDSQALFYLADKDALTAGPGAGNLYAAWDDFAFESTDILLGLPVAHSTDGGKTWTVTYPSRFSAFASGCSSNQYIGAQPLVVGGTVYVAAELISVNDPTCTFPPPAPTFSEAVFSSADGGSTWTPGAVIPVTPSTPQASGFFELGPGQFMRNLEFPTLASFKGSLYLAWNDGGDGSGHSHVRLAQSTDGGQTFSTSFVTSGTNDEAQPAMSADGGLHIAYYQISTGSDGNGQLDVFVSNSSNGNAFKVQRVTSQSSPGVETIPQFDPFIAFGYMGDYIANTSDGSHQYLAWGDNRDIVTDFLWPNGRHDPDVFFAKQ